MAGADEDALRILQGFPDDRQPVLRSTDMPVLRWVSGPAGGIPYCVHQEAGVEADKTIIYTAIRKIDIQEQSMTLSKCRQRHPTKRSPF